jgi:hypothetical protein
MRIFVLGDSFADNLFAEAYNYIGKFSPSELNNRSRNFSPIQRYLLSLKNENIDKAKWFTDWLEEWGYEIINLGTGGCTNQHIFYQFAKIDKEFREGDRIILHWTDHCRFDWIADETGRTIWVHPAMNGFKEPLRSVLHNHSICIDESFKTKNKSLNNHLVPFMDWIVEKHSEYNPIVWSVFSHTMQYLNKSRFFNTNSSYFSSLLKDNWNIKKESNGFFDDGHFGRYGNYYVAVLFDEIIKSGITANFDETHNREYITKITTDRIKNENLIFKNPQFWNKPGLEKFI